MKIGTMSQQNRPDKMKRPRFFNCEEVPRQIVSSAMAQVLSESRCSTSAVLRRASASNKERRFTNRRRFWFGGFKPPLVRLKARADREVEVLSGQSTGCPKMKVTASSRDGVGSNRKRTASP